MYLHAFINTHTRASARTYAYCFTHVKEYVCVYGVRARAERGNTITTIVCVCVCVCVCFHCLRKRTRGLFSPPFVLYVYVYLRPAHKSLRGVYVYNTRFTYP
uniref:Uncharacterized protein n=1 Tax=Sipha flava TaxID=143950 RepID=A0A2S2R4S9_9HEMI